MNRGTRWVDVFSLVLCSSILASMACDTSELSMDADIRDSSTMDTTPAQDGSNDADSDAEMDVGSHPDCPALELSVGTSRLEISRSVEAKPNLFESNSLAWGDEGDDTVLIEARQSGTYIVGVEFDGEETPQGLGIAVPEEAEFYTSDICPTQSMTKTLPNARFLATAGESGSLDLEEGDTALLIFSCSSGCETAGIGYTLTIQRECSPTCG